MKPRTCSACLQPDHERRRCPELHGPVGPDRFRSRSGQAVLYALAHNVALHVAAPIFGVSSTAARNAYNRAFGQVLTHTQEAIRERNARVLELAGSGLYGKEIAAQLGMSESNVKRVLSDAGVSLVEARRAARAERAA